MSNPLRPVLWAETRGFSIGKRGDMKKKKAAFFDFAPIDREIFPVNDEICSKTSTKMEYNVNKYNIGIYPLIFSGKNPL